MIAGYDGKPNYSIYPNINTIHKKTNVYNMEKYWFISLRKNIGMEHTDVLF